LRGSPKFSVFHQDELVRKGINEFLESQLRLCFAEIHEIKTRYEVKSVAGLEKIRKGAIAEHPAWEDLIVLENMKSELRRFEKS
jgi:hypothetical protein